MEVRQGYKQTEVGEIPREWDILFLGEFFLFKNGINKAKEFFGYGTPIVNYMDVYRHPGLFFHNLDGRVDVNKQELKAFEVRRADVFFTRTSETVEEVGITSVMLDESLDTVFSGFVLRARPKDDRLDEQFMKYCFSSSIVRKQITSKSTYTTRALTNGRALSAVAIACPPKPEQCAIAAALSDVDALISGFDQLIAKKRNIKQATMQQLLTGKQRLKGFSNEKIKFKQTEVGLIPSDWEVGNLGDFLHEPPTYGINAPSLPYQDKLPAYIRITDITEEGHFSTERITSVAGANTQKYFLNDGDLVFARTGASVGKSYLYNSDDGRLVFAGFLIRVKPNQAFLAPGFLAAYVKTWRYWNWVRLMSMRSGQPGINSNEYSQLPIPLPSIHEQNAISTVLSDMDAEIASLEHKRDKTCALKQGMMQELLTGRIRLV